MRRKLTNNGIIFTALPVAVIGILMATLVPKPVLGLTRSGTGQAASLVALDLERAVALAVREGKPVRITCDCANGRYTVADRASGAVILTRRVAGGKGEINVQSLTFSATPIDVLPSGLVSTPLTVTLTSNGTSRQVTMSAGGFVTLVR